MCRRHTIVAPFLREETPHPSLGGGALLYSSKKISLRTIYFLCQKLVYVQYIFFAKYDFSLTDQVSHHKAGFIISLPKTNVPSIHNVLQRKVKAKEIFFCMVLNISGKIIFFFSQKSFETKLRLEVFVLKERALYSKICPKFVIVFFQTDAFFCVILNIFSCHWGISPPPKNLIFFIPQKTSFFFQAKFSNFLPEFSLIN